MTTSGTGPKRTAIAVSALAACPLAIAEDYAEGFFRAAQTGGAEARIALPGLPGLARRVALTFGLHFRVVDGGATSDEIRFRWASGFALLPDFRGALHVRAAGDEQTLVELDGSYVAPLGLAGRAFDALAGRRIARASLTDFARRIAAHLTHERRAWLAGHRPPETVVEYSEPSL